MPPLKDTTKLLSKLRVLMKDKSLLNGVELEAYIVPSSDAHGSEYLAEKDKRRSFISGFTGSSGTALVTQSNGALLWTDGRYYLQANQELDSNWSLMKDGLIETPSIGDWLVKNLPSCSKVGIDSRLYEEDLYQTLATKLRANKIDMYHTKINLVDLVWNEEKKEDLSTDNSSDPLILLNEEHIGQTTRQKLIQIREQLERVGTDSTVITSLDEIAWVLNMRGRDIPFGAVFFSYLIITKTGCKLFTDLKRLLPELRAYLKKHEENFEFYEYEEFYSFYEQFVRNVNQRGKKIYLSSLSNHLIHSLVESNAFIHKELSIIAKLKFIKNSREIELARSVHLKDSAVLCEFFYKLDKQFSENNESNQFEGVKILDEFEVAKYLDQMRTKLVGFLTPSFETICGFGSNGAIIHYKPKIGDTKRLERNNLFLVDSGGHYLDLGTTDVTRTVFLGNPLNISDYQRECFTLVLKGHIQLALKVFPNGTRPELLDSFARFSLWQAGLDYRHGTGHGVGSLLNVHEIPIIANRKSALEFGGIQEHMIITNEPGYYENENFGIRIENCYLTMNAITKYSFGNTTMLRFDALTLVPIQLELVEKSLLNGEEIAWLNAYHAKCMSLVGEQLKKSNNIEVYNWLVYQTRSI